jgi:hypothetical protein
MNHIAQLSVALTLLLFGATVDIAKAQNVGSPPASSPSTLSPVDYNFVAQANLGAPSRSIPAGSPKRRPQLLICATMRI